MSAAILAQAHSVFLEAEVAPAKVDDFEADYSSITGSSPAGHPNLQLQPNKWGAECRVYFNAGSTVVSDLRANGQHIEERDGGYHDEYDYRINNNDLFWELVKHGYRLGANAPLPE